MWSRTVSQNKNKVTFVVFWLQIYQNLIKNPIFLQNTNKTKKLKRYKPNRSCTKLYAKEMIRWTPAYPLLLLRDYQNKGSDLKTNKRSSRRILKEGTGLRDSKKKNYESNRIDVKGATCIEENRGRHKYSYTENVYLRDLPNLRNCRRSRYPSSPAQAPARTADATAHSSLPPSGAPPDRPSLAPARIPRSPSPTREEQHTDWK